MPDDARPDGSSAGTQTGFFATQITAASWLRLGVVIALLVGFSAWAFGPDSPWTAALNAADGALPEVKIGLPAVEPQRSIDLLRAAPNGALGQYQLWQLVDLPYIALNFLVMSLGAAIGLKSLKMQHSALRFALIIPFIYVAGEIGENFFLSLFAADILPPYGDGALAQQALTTLKMSAAMVGFISALAGVSIGAVVTVLKFLKFRR